MGALSIGAPAVALATGTTNIDMLVAPEENAFSRGHVKLSGSNADGTAVKQEKDGSWVIKANADGAPVEVTAASVKPLGVDKDIPVTDKDAYKVTFATADGKAVDEIVEPGSYVISVEDLKGDYKGAVATAKLTVKAASLKNVTWFDADSTMEKQVEDNTLVYTGSELHVGFADRVAFTEGEDYAVKILKKGTDNVESAPGVAIKDAGDYVAYVTGLGQYKGQTKQVEIKVNKFELSQASQVVVNDVIASESAPSHADLIYFGSKGTEGYAELDPSLVKLEFSKENTGEQQLFQKPGAYKFNVVNPLNDSIDFTVKDSDKVTVNKVAAYADFEYDGEAIQDSYIVNKAKGESFDLGKVRALNGDKKAAFTVSATRKGSTVSSGELTLGKWEVTVTVDPKSNNYQVGGSKTFTVQVVKDAVNADVNVFVYYDGKAVTSVEKTYDGKDIVKSDFTVKAFNDDNTDLSKDLSFNFYDADGKKVNKITDAGTYTLKIESDILVLSGTTEIPVTVNKVDLSKLYVIGGDSWYGAPYVATHANDLTYAQLVGYDTHVAVSDSKDDANDREGVESLGNVAEVEFNKYLKMEIFDEAKQEWVEVSYPNRLKDEGKRRVTLTGNKELAKNFEFANDDYTTTVEFIVVDKDKLVFNDVKPGDWFFDVVFDAQANKWMNGYADGVLFGAHDQITRGQVACVLFNMAGADMNETDGSFNEVFGWKSFDDVDGKAYYGEAIAWAKQAGVVNGYGDGTFRPDAPVTREELACMLANYAKKVDQADVTVEDADKVLSSMSDGSAVSEWAKGSVAWAVENEIMGNAGFVNAYNDITRAETAAMVVNYKA
ncbi:S-layer homology domain-containing protein [Collinsella tanakaei]|uniref:S-layer homology domain-containing protein n=1 Tax=Collinsella tanakaei TaxID=626935 RepID=UPI0022E4D3BF|nr:S-layer homology domain-containing protein [Collinsella tanakaei]